MDRINSFVYRNVLAFAVSSQRQIAVFNFQYIDSISLQMVCSGLASGKTFLDASFIHSLEELLLFHF